MTRAGRPADGNGEDKAGFQGVVGGVEVAFAEFHADGALAADAHDDGKGDQKAVERDDEVDGGHRVRADKVADEDAVDEDLRRQQKERQHARYDEFDEKPRDRACGEFFFSPGGYPVCFFACSIF